MFGVSQRFQTISRHGGLWQWTRYFFFLPFSISQPQRKLIRNFIKLTFLSPKNLLAKQVSSPAGRRLTKLDNIWDKIMKKTRDFENILSLPTIQNYQNSFLSSSEIKSVPKFVPLKNGLKSFKLTLVMIWGFGQFKVVIYVWQLGSRRITWDLTWHGKHAWNRKSLHFDWLERGWGAWGYKKDTNLNCGLRKSTCIAHYNCYSLLYVAL